MNPNDDITHQGPSPTLADFLTVPYSKEVITTQEYAMVAGEKILEKEVVVTKEFFSAYSNPLAILPSTSTAS